MSIDYRAKSLISFRVVLGNGKAYMRADLKESGRDWTAGQVCESCREKQGLSDVSVTRNLQCESAVACVAICHCGIMTQ
jgi:hypothetical protein